MKVLGIMGVDFDVTEQQLIRYFVFVKYWRENGNIGTAHQLFIDFEKAHDSVRTER